MPKLSRSKYRKAKLHSDMSLENICGTNNNQENNVSSDVYLSNNFQADNNARNNVNIHATPLMVASENFNNDLTLADPGADPPDLDGNKELDINISLSPPVSPSPFSDLEDSISNVVQNLGVSDNITKKKDITSELTEWALKFNISHIALSDLLKRLKPTFNELPLDARSLLHTPRNLEYKIVFPGQYFHFGLEKCIKNLFCCIKNKPIDKIEIYVNIDGLPLSKSSGSQFYPILCSLVQNRNVVDIIGIYHGNEKPKNVNEFLKDFVEEVNKFSEQGIIINDQKYQFTIKAFIVDVPAKAFITSTKGHNGYYSCSKCEIEGVFIQNRVCFPNVNNLVLRNNYKFRQKTQEEHHLGASILEKIPSLNMIDLSLHVSIYILSSPSASTELTNYASELLEYFVHTFSLLYGQEHCSHNIHNLLHLHADFTKFGPLFNFSAFPFENFMQIILKLVRKQDKPLAQIVFRKSELNDFLYKQESSVDEPTFKSRHFNGPLIDIDEEYEQFQKVHCQNFLLTVESPDHCCSLKNGNLILIRNILIKKGLPYIIGHRFLNVSDFFTEPIKSSLLGIYLVRNLDKLQQWPLSEITSKCLK
ncbi:unnamed protein product [Ceutorhynchus assimilis]|uniref:Transposase domain-containing protein n=1 Tax=Ceutorhynchus assimilis TaxID=467358 RepID=A0A9N9MNT7_9CUCU|nr:unnamed protein product [Ceutorhynchus assimilis]